ncbi:MAG TPA: 4,5-dihydroxyphthalate decarboxylase [Methylomirabilota bacterium]|jgi:4,5-dihydroxyphthalate decarboxylase|nr:4,5-dihydroxyphthalate decarboxylase [Methylomirabilota bacterium]
MRKVPLTLAISDYDHVRELTSGAIAPEGIELTCLNLTVEEIFYRFVSFREWDVSELSMAKYVALVSQGDASLAAIPVFPSRIFRHSAIYVRRDGGLRQPTDLAGRRVGVPEWAQTAGIYTRGALMHQYGLRLEDVDWYQAGVNQPGRQEKVDLRLPPGVRLTPVRDRTLDQMLLAGELAAVITAHPPTSFKAQHPDVARLFPDVVSVEEAYWRATGIFPIMHVVAIRRDVLAAHPWVAMNLYRAFEEAKRRSMARTLDWSAPRFPVPWVTEHAARSRALFGEDFWPYGVDANRPTLEAFLRFACEQGVAHRPVGVDELFPPEVRSTFRV